MTTLRHQVAGILERAGWSLPPLPVAWSPRLVRTAGLFVVERDRRGVWHPEIRLSIPLLRRRDRAWPVQACGCACSGPHDLVQRILEHELIHYKLWHEGCEDWGHTAQFRRIAREAFGHGAVTHAIGAD